MNTTPTTETGTAKSSTWNDALPNTTTEGATKWALETFTSKPLNEWQTNQINNLRQQTAWLWDTIDNITDRTKETTTPEVARLTSLAKTNLEQAFMWATKAISRK